MAIRRRKRYRRRRPWVRRRRFVKAVRRIASRSGEVKSYSVSYDGAVAITTSWSSSTITNLIAQGTAREDRIGNRIFVKAALVNLWFKPAASDGHNWIRTILWRSGDQVGNIVGTDLPSGTYHVPPRDKGVRYLMDKTVAGNFINTHPVSSSDAISLPRIKKFIRINKTCRYLGTGAGSSYAAGGSIGVSMVSDSGAAPSPVACGYVKIWYTDC